MHPHGSTEPAVVALRNRPRSATGPHSRWAQETVNLAGDPVNRELVATYLAKLEALIDAEMGRDDQPWIPEKPLLPGAPKWRGDA